MVLEALLVVAAGREEAGEVEVVGSRRCRNSAHDGRSRPGGRAAHSG